jgi:hypothetical protein
MNERYVLDIETRGNPAAAEKLWKPSEYKTHGNIKDPVKLQAHRATWEEAQAEAKALFIERAALSPLTGTVCCIGLADDAGEIKTLEGDERTVLTEFWRRVSLHENATTKWVYWSGSGSYADNFDLDFIVTRSRLIGVPVPPSVRSGRFYNPRFVDLAAEFLLYRSGEYLSLTNAGELFGLYDGKHGVTPKRKDDEVTGANFAVLYDLGGESRQKALAYLANDLKITYHLANAILG